MPSTIRLFGLGHKIEIFRKANKDDGSGGIQVSDENEVIYSRLKARISAMTDEDEQKGFGNITGERWKVVATYAPNAQRSDFLMLSNSSHKAPIPYNTLYRVLYVKHQIDHVVRFHHTSMVVELEDVDS